MIHKNLHQNTAKDLQNSTPQNEKIHACGQEHMNDIQRRCGYSITPFDTALCIKN